MIKVSPSNLAKAILRLKGKPLDLSEYKPFEAVYDSSPDTLTLCAGRQVGKSVSLAASITCNSILRPHFSTLMVSPLAQQTSRFSSQYLGPFFSSPIIRSHFIDSSSIQNIFSKSLTNGSSITLGYCDDETSADRIRGVAADMLLCDECQDLSIDAIPVLQETLSASEYSFKRFTGTAKTAFGTLSILFNRSNGMEWVVKCTSCGKHSIPNDFENCLKIATGNPLGPACVHCGHLIDMKTGQWLAAKPDIKNHVGMHIPQIIIPARTNPKKWGELLEKVKNYDKIKLSNEVFGLSVGSGGRPLSLQQVMATCNPQRTSFDIGFPRDDRRILYTVIGVDWSVTGSTQSYTVVTVMGYDSLGKCYILHSQKMEGMDLLDQIAIIERIYYQFECSHIGCDRGVGAVQYQILKRDLGEGRVSSINYVAAKTNLRYDKQGDFFAADRTMAIDTMVIKIKGGPDKIEGPSWNLMHSFWKDALSLFEEETLAGRRVFRREEDIPDDFIHSLVFGNLAFMILKGEFMYQEKDAVVDNTFTF
jgi:hypothetical protein